MEEIRENTYSVTPTLVLDDMSLNNNEKVLYTRISSLTNKYGYCFATNKYLAKLLGTSERNLKRWLKNLIDKNYIISEIKYKNNSKEIEERRLKLADLEVIKRRLLFSEMSRPWDNDDPTPQDKDDPDNNISSNTIRLIKEKEIYKEKESFCKPTIEEIREYCRERNNSVDAEAFYYHYESKGWLIGKAKMKSWKAAVITWERSAKNNPAPKKKKSSFFF